MKKIEAVIRTHQLDAVKDALRIPGISGVTATEVRGFGRQRGHAEIYRGVEYAIQMREKIKIEVVVHEDLVSRVVDTIIRVARSGRPGDGMIFVSSVEQAVRIRTGEQDEAAIA